MVDGVLNYKEDDYSEMIYHLQSLGESPTILLLNGINSDSGTNTVPASFNGIENFEVDNSPLLFNEISDLRVIKTPMEQGKVDQDLLGVLGAKKEAVTKGLAYFFAYLPTTKRCKMLTHKRGYY